MISKEVDSSLTINNNNIIIIKYPLFTILTNFKKIGDDGFITASKQSDAQ